MSNYTIAVAWNGKDALSDSDAAKVISGDEFHTEFSAVQTSVNSKAELNGSATESFSATTASAGTNTTQVATTAFVTSAAVVAYPIGSIFTSTVAYANSAAVVAAVGGTTWTAFGAGKVLIGVDSSDTDFDTVEETGGSKTHTLTTSEIPAHTHSVLSTTDTGNNTPVSSGGKPYLRQGSDNGGLTSGSTGSGSAHNNVQPYITVYMWKRTA